LLVGEVEVAVTTGTRAGKIGTRGFPAGRRSAKVFK